MLDTTKTLAELATSVPAASRVFHRHRLDFCCGGGISLADACAQRGIDVAGVASEIEAQTSNAPDPTPWVSAPLPALVDHIVERYHQPLRLEIPRLRAMAEKVEAVHADKASCPVGLAAHLANVEQEVTAHLLKEEQVLFPMIREGAGRLALGPIRVMLLEHDDHAANLRKIRELTGDLVAGPDACNTWRALYLGLEELERELMEHISLENNVLFPRVLRPEQALSGS
jgi:regulator of cell morphogenesis and NO signaling